MATGKTGRGLITLCLVSIVLVSPGFAQLVSFAPALNSSAGSGPLGVAIGDFNEDGKLDLAVVNRNNNNVSIFLGTGTGSFGAPTNFAVGVNPEELAVGDVNGDGHLDLVVANFGTNFVSPHTVSVLLGDGTGQFGTAINIPVVGANPSSVVIGDLNGDGKPDVVVSLSGSWVIETFLGDGTGSFSLKAIRAVPCCPVGLALGDFNKDGKLDVAAAGADSSGIFILLGNGDGTLGAPTSIATGLYPVALAVADLNGDGNLDLAVVNQSAFSSNVSILLGDGTGSFAPATNFSVGFQAGPESLAIGDLNGDGKLDIVTGNTKSFFSVLLGDGTGSFSSPLTIAAGNHPFFVGIGDFNEDGRPDVVVSNNADNNISVFLNTTQFAIPVANAGADQTVDEGALVTLDGSASTGQDLTFNWEQIAGLTVTLSNATSPQAAFTTPFLPGGFGSQVLTFGLTVSSGDQSSSDTVDITVRNVDHAPEAHAGADQAVNEGSLVTLDGSTSFEPDGDAITFQWAQTGGAPVALTGADTSKPTFTAPLIAGGISGMETLTFELTVSDSALSATDQVTVFVEQVNHAPVADAGNPQTVHSGTLVTLNGSASQDPDGDPITLQWTQVDGPMVALTNATSTNPSFVAPPVPGSTGLTFRLTVSDTQLTGDAEVVITVKNGPPLCNLARPVPSVLWPPNHGMVVVGISGVTDPDDASVTITIQSATQDEPVNGVGDGDTSPDAVIQGDKVLLRAERSGKGNGRVYEIRFTADDGQGGTCSGSGTVGVPHSMKPGMSAVDDGQLYDSIQP